MKKLLFIEGCIKHSKSTDCPEPVKLKASLLWKLRRGADIKLDYYRALKAVVMYTKQQKEEELNLYKPSNA